jgi:hypothetical protein
MRKLQTTMVFVGLMMATFAFASDQRTATKAPQPTPKKCTFSVTADGYLAVEHCAFSGKACSPGQDPQAAGRTITIEECVVKSAKPKENSCPYATVVGRSAHLELALRRCFLRAWHWKLWHL